MAYNTYRRYYPPLRSTKCATPYPNPAEGGFSKVKDEEERVRGAAEFDLDEFDEVDEEGENRPLNSRRRDER